MWREGGGGCIRTEGASEVAPKRLDRRLEEVAKAVEGGYCRLQMPLKLALGVRRQQLGVGWAPCLPMHPWVGGARVQRQNGPGNTAAKGHTS